MRYLAGTLLAMLLTLFPARASVQDVVPNAPGDLGVKVAIARDPNFIQAWLTTSFDKPVTIPRLHELKIGKTAYVAFLITGYAPGAQGIANYVVDVKVLGPDGSVLFNLPRYAKYKGEVRGRGFIMADPALDYVSEAGDSLGIYKIQATVRDVPNGEKGTGESRFTLVP